MIRIPGLLSAVAIAMFLMACGDDDTMPTSDDVEAVLALIGDSANGSVIFSQSCGISSCHGPDGNSGTQAAALSTVIPDFSDRDVVSAMLNGSGSMPSQLLTNQEAADVLAYVNATF